jgi:hypothetical protein
VAVPQAMAVEAGAPASVVVVPPLELPLLELLERPPLLLPELLLEPPPELLPPGGTGIVLPSGRTSTVPPSERVAMVPPLPEPELPVPTPLEPLSGGSSSEALPHPIARRTALPTNRRVLLDFMTRLASGGTCEWWVSLRCSDHRRASLRRIDRAVQRGR